MTFFYAVRHAWCALRVTDHKTGALPKKAPQFVGFGEALQPVLYSLAAEAALGRPVAAGRLHYATLRQNFKVGATSQRPPRARSAAGPGKSQPGPPADRPQTSER